MAIVTVYNQQKEETGKINLSSKIFEVQVQPEILHLVVRAQLAAKRAGTHSVKTRGHVSGGGAKPWRQKGTGRARAGSNRSPLWRGGGIVFGPQPRDYSFKVNKKIRSLALCMALSSRFAEENLIVIDNIVLPEIKTKHFVGVANILGLHKALIVAPVESTQLLLSMRNVPNVKLLTYDRLNVYDILKYKQLVLLEGAVQHIEARLK
ncbi:50S ribosomal protein L4 [Lawsonia intracellularis]|uniref:Large ribosomal subunit protein uL4 n=1 Tax=Lawsonia intracellularis (strain PHE/MN1-00) TaxID=363253 RepID=RL4_LAWIP|nr:50S ribosomal protein L4 [Lawsonia intracellularis]Q1MPR2.1 RecName: Full=Large ribosomal subunit protein uL4; AltName: Full=50S ribosomal protein L4 [Lawsonia intracellularis PHE/MN1-00]AGC50389.1 50S ribosomal protein L4 [Lawsonia intracellularis N343]KAA0204411.1 50S ribosomal protein L4 [Lawsonia intracellularis]MBZ3892836.1 50S ribosomal protein L4 [Lawsonia intracellularis]RBN33004.1 50S ribosomal protein L4 [Lawsonia intracellularis]RBN35174.1 50S ribosomal protein L4 [Lawsonia intr